MDCCRYHIKTIFLLFVLAALFVMNLPSYANVAFSNLNHLKVMSAIFQNNAQSNADSDKRKVVCEANKNLLNCLSDSPSPYRTSSSESSDREEGESENQEYENSESLAKLNNSKSLINGKNQKHLITTNFNFYYQTSFFPQFFRPPIIF